MKSVQVVRVVTEPEEEAVRKMVEEFVLSLKEMGVKSWVESVALLQQETNE